MKISRTLDRAKITQSRAIQKPAYSKSAYRQNCNYDGKLAMCYYGPNMDLLRVVCVGGTTYIDASNYRQNRKTLRAN